MIYIAIYYVYVYYYPLGETDASYGPFASTPPIINATPICPLYGNNLEVNLVMTSLTLLYLLRLSLYNLSLA